MLGLKRGSGYWLAALAGALLVALGLWSPRTREVEAPVPLERAQPALRSRPARSARESAPAAAATPQPAPSAPVIDQVEVEKTDLCVGEETLVTVRAHTPDDNDAELHYLIGTAAGQSVPLRAWVDEQGQPPPFQVTVFGKGNVASSAPVPPLRIQPCHVDTFAVISHRALPNRWGSFAFRADLRQHQPGAPAKAAALGARRYLWTFGDGSTEQTDTPDVTHSYEGRPQQTLYSQFLVRVEVKTRDGRTLVARDALQLVNPAYESWTRKGIVSLMVALDPPFPVLSDSGRVEQGVRLRHYRPEPVTIESVQAVRYYAGGAGQSPAQSVDVASLLGTDTIPAGEGLQLRVTLDAQAQPDVISVSYYLKGKSADGHPVVGSFSVMRPPPAPNASNSTPITDPQLVAKIRRARERLGKSVVSDTDLARLEREGAFNDL
ncbi:MAG TPA: hypothetical protein VFS67_28220 [Polyangiaceae bacterium]|nr:hypothetical protein [Polyangiaceae bacterium]